jgi:DNA primase
MILPGSIQEVNDAAKIEEVVGDFVNLKRRGANYSGLCPFHNEKTPSFNVNPARNIFKCFGCGKAGDPITFVMEHEQVSYVEAVRYLAKKYRIELKETEYTDQQREAQRELDSLYLVNQFAHDYFQQQLFETDRGKSVGLAYFKQRGFREETMRNFGLGFTQNEWDGLLNTAKRAGYNPDLLKKLGLLTQSERDFFRDRVMFSIHNLTGKVIAFAGRIMNKDPKQPKYINSPETEIYLKSKVLYGMFQAKKAIRQLDECLLVEGYTDVISLHQSGIENVVASSGTALTPDQIRLIKRFTPNIRFVYDGDAAGIKAALRGLDLALEEDMDVRLVLLPNQEDPDSFVQRVGADAFKEYLVENGKDIVQFEAELLLKEAGNDPTKRAGVLGQIAKTIAKIRNPLRRDEYLKVTRQLLAVDEGKLLHEVNRQVKQDLEKQQKQREATPDWDEEESEQEMPRPRPQMQEQTISIGDEFQEKDLIRVLVHFGNEMYDPEHEVTVAQFIWLNIQDVVSEFDNAFYRRVLEGSMAQAQQGIALSHGFFLQHREAEIRQLAANLLSSPYEFSEGWEKRKDILLNQKMPEQNFQIDANLVIKQLKLRKIGRIIRQNQEKIKSNPEDLMDLLRLDQRLKEMRNSLAVELGIVVV